jgi:hypothetical protein
MLSWSHAVASGASILIVGLSEASIITPPTVLSVTFDGRSLNPIGTESATVGLKFSHVELWSLLNPPAVTATITLTLSATETAVVGSAVSFFNVIGTTAFVGSNDAAGTTPSVTVPAVSGELVIDVLATCSTFAPCGNSATAPAPTTGSPIYVSGEINGELFGAASDAPASSPVTLSWVYTSSDWAMGGVALEPTSPIPEYPWGLAVLAVLMITSYGFTRRRVSQSK